MQEQLLSHLSSLTYISLNTFYIAPFQRSSYESINTVAPMMGILLLEISLAEVFCEETGWIHDKIQHQSYNQVSICEM